MTSRLAACALALFALPALAQETVEVAGITFQVPEGWVVEEPASTSMMKRLAQMKLPRAEGDEADAELVALQAGGTVAANLERWRGMFQANEDEKKAWTEEKVDVDGTAATVVLLTGEYQVPPFMRREGDPETRKGHAMLGVVLETTPLTFFRILGPRKTIEAHRAKVLEFLRSGAKKEE